MQSYEINQGKRKKAIKQVVKTNVKTSKGVRYENKVNGYNVLGNIGCYLRFWMHL